MADGQKCTETDVKTMVDSMGKNKPDMTVTDKTKLCDSMTKVSVC